MCGIAGGHGLHRDQVDAMVASMHHRGPDGRGFFQQENFVMGMARLAIQDRSRGKQPFTSSCGRFQAIFNGEIYNWRELRAELLACNHHFSTECDGEILPAAWQEWKGAMLIDSRTRPLRSEAPVLFRYDTRDCLCLRDQGVTCWRSYSKSK